MMTGLLDGVAVTTNPFPGLRPFREDEEYLFFGRESQIDKIVDKLSLNRFLAVVGTSGSGKSSLVNCGLRPALRRGLMPAAGTSWRFVQFRPGAHPVEAMAQALAADGVLFAQDAVPGLALADFIGATLRMSNLGLADVFEQARLPERTNLLVIADQFEELFRFRSVPPTGGGAPSGAGEEAATFVNLLLAGQATELPIYVVLTMRSDFLGDCAQFHGLPEAINEGQYLVPRLTRDERRAAIAGPVEVMGARINPVLLTRLVNDAGDNPDQLSILQHALNRTWARWRRPGGGEGSLSADSYEAIGTMAHALDAHAEKAFGELRSERQRLICERLFKALTDRGSDPRGIRRPTSVERLCAITGASAVELEAVIDVFRKPSRSFLMPPIQERLQPHTIIDISHESLMRVWKRLHAWTLEEAESARIYRRIRDTAELNAVGRARLLRDPELQIALDWRRRERPTDQWADFYDGGLRDVVDFIDRSKAEQDTEKAEVEFQRRWARWCAIPGAIVLFGLYAYTTRTMRVEIEALANVLTPDLVGGSLRLAFAFVLESTLPAVPFILAGMGLASWGRQTYRRLTFASVLEQVSTAATDAPPRIVPETAAAPPAIEALRTTYASLGRRFIATLVDLGVYFVLLFVSFFPLAIADGTNWPIEDPLGDDVTGVASDAAIVWWIGLVFVSHAIYHVITQSSARRASLGMRAAGIIVTDAHGGRLSTSRAVARQMAKILSLYTMPISYLIQLFTKKRQMLHDLVTKTVILRAPAKPDAATDRDEAVSGSA